MTVETRDQISVLSLLSVVLKHRYAIVGLSLGTAFLVGLLGLMADRTYTASGSFIPQGAEARGGGVAQLAGQFGISLPTSGGAATESPQFYVDLLRSREILARVLTDTFSVVDVDWRGGRNSRSGTLSELLELEEGNAAFRRDRAIRWLQRNVNADQRVETGVVRVYVTTPWPNLSEDLGRRLLDLVHDFNRRTRQTQAAAQRSFIEQQLVEAEERLGVAEEELKRFLESNRQFRNSPELEFEHDRLQRQVQMRQSRFTGLSQAYDDARIAEVRDTPLITVLEAPEEPVHPDPRGLTLRAALGLLVGGMGGAFFAIARDLIGRGRSEEDDDYREFDRVWRETLGDVKKLFGPGRG